MSAKRRFSRLGERTASCTPLYDNSLRRLDLFSRPLLPHLRSATPRLYFAPLPRRFHETSFDQKAWGRNVTQTGTGMSKIEITKRTVEALKAATKDYIAFDTGLPGFGVTRTLPATTSTAAIPLASNK